MNYRVFAIAAHPDDIEFGMAGTLILLVKTGCEVHYMNMANGSCGTAEHDIESIVKIRLDESENAARKIGAIFHPPLVADLEIYYHRELIARLGSIIRKVSPDILLVPSPDDYMEDHMITSRLATTAAFIRGMRNCKVNPPVIPVDKDITLYHAQPHGNRDALNRLITPDIFIDVGEVMKEKTEMLAEHKSQKEWLDHSQGFDSYLNTMQEYAREVGKLSNRFEFAEGWRRHNPLGFCAQNSNPLLESLKEKVFFSG
jgi:N-acetylglucosamine malate deacetylase 1